jgi:hypothetical protein
MDLNAHTKKSQKVQERKKHVKVYGLNIILRSNYTPDKKNHAIVNGFEDPYPKKSKSSRKKNM